MAIAPVDITYVSVVSRETVRIALSLAALNGLEVKVSDVENAYITAPVCEKMWTVLRSEHGSDAGKKGIMIGALYGLKSSSAAFRAHLCKCMKSFGYTPCLADPELWPKPDVDENFHYYSYILCYMDDIMVIHHDDCLILDKIDKYMNLKESSTGDQDIYLGAKLRQMEMPNGVLAWGISPSKYVQEAVHNCEIYLEDND